MASNSATPRSLPPSVEQAYKRKCIELRRRQHEVEDQNDAARLRKLRLIRGVRKLRLERSMLLQALSRRQHKNGHGAIGLYDDEESDDSSDNPPTVSLQS